MIPVSGQYHGYRVKTEYEHLLPTVYGRPSNYVLFPFCLPSYDPMLELATDALEREIGPDLSRAEQVYPGSFNSKLL